MRTKSSRRTLAVGIALLALAPARLGYTQGINPNTAIKVLEGVSSVLGIGDKILGQMQSIGGKGTKTVPERTPASGIPDYNSKITLSKDGQSLEHREGSYTVGKISYQDVMGRLSTTDVMFIQTHEKSMEANYFIWAAVYPTLATEVDPVRKAQIEQQLTQIKTKMADDLNEILIFVQDTCHMGLDDHYIAMRHLTADMQHSR
jgi:hypothetical protein